MIDSFCPAARKFRATAPPNPWPQPEPPSPRPDPQPPAEPPRPPEPQPPVPPMEPGLPTYEDVPPVKPIDARRTN